MATKNGRAPGLYIYSIVMASDATDLGPIGIIAHGDPGEVYPIVVGEVAAMVSRIGSPDRVPPIRRNLDAQNRVLRALHDLPGGLIPMRFGHVVNDERAVRSLLSEHQASFVQTLSSLRGKAEMSLVTSWDVPNIFEHMMKTDPVLVEMRDRLFADGQEPTRAERIDLGQSFAERIDHERRSHTELVREAIEPHVAGIVEDPVHSDTGIMRLSILVERSKLGLLEERIGEVAAQVPDTIVFKYTGPFAPFHFVTLDLDGDAGDAFAQPEAS